MESGWQEAVIVNGGAGLLAQAKALAEDLPDPERWADDLQAFLVAHADQAVALRRLGGHRALELLLRLGGHSRYAFAIACREPEAFWHVVEGGQHRQSWGRRRLREALHQACGRCGDPAQRPAALAGFKHRQWLRIILGDIAGELPLPAVMAELSDATDALVQAALELAVERIARRFGEPVPPDHLLHPGLVVLGLGKLGGHELNYSSDIDLIFAYELTAGAQELSIDHHEWFTRVGSELIRVLEEGDGTGALFRVDMRLRPEGERGELALSRHELVDYYYAVGRPWERQALLKARPIAGSLLVGEHLLGDLAPWVYPVEPAWEDLDESRAMRRRIEERAVLDDVKTGAGGIRDIEFLVQFLQLSYGGRMPELRRRDTLPTLGLLADRGLLPRADAEALTEHYAWLRHVEHRLQFWEDRQEHRVPLDPLARDGLARRCGFRGDAAIAAFEVRWNQVRDGVRRICERHFLGGDREADARLALLAQGEADPVLAAKILGPAGFRDIAQAVNHIRALAVEPFFVLSRSRTERSLAAVLPLLLHLFARSGDPDQALANFLRVVQAVGGRATFYDLLAARPRVLALFADLAGWSRLLVDTLAEQPGLPDEVVDALNRRPTPAAALQAEARAVSQGLGDPVPTLAWLQARELAGLALRDLGGLGIEAVGERLSALAEGSVQVLLARLMSDRAKRHGYPVGQGRACRFAILALGKLGGRELSYLSDLDVLFLCDPGGCCPKDPERDGPWFFTRVAQDLMRVCGENRLWEVDARLRPWGEQSDLVCTLDSFDRYWSEPRELWERMAMLRARHLAGDPRLSAEAVERLRRACAQPPADWAAQVHDMRRRLEESVQGEDNLKRGPGGYVDIEFSVQALAQGIDPLPDPPGTAACLHRLAELGRLPREGADRLVEALRFLRFAENRLRLAEGRPVSALPTDPATRTVFARRCGCVDLGDFEARLQRARSLAREWFDRLVG